MKIELTRFARFAIVAACAALPLAGTGCEKAESQADRDAIQQLRQATTVHDLSKGSGGIDKLAQAIQQVAARTDTSDRVKAAARAELGAVKYAQAMSLLSRYPDLSKSQGQPGLSSAEMQQMGIVQKQARALDLIAEIDTAAARIARNNLAAAALAQSDPSRAPSTGGSAPLDELTKAMAEHRKNGDNAEKQADAAKAQIAQLENQVKELQQTAQAASKQSVDLIDKSERSQGAQAVEMYKQGVEQRKKAEDATFAIGQAQAKIKEQQAIVAEQQKQQELWSQAVKDDQAAIDSLKTTWSTSQDAASERSKQSTEMAGDKGIAGLAKQLDDLLTEVAQQEKSAMELLDASEKAYNQAWDAAKNVQKDTNALISATSSQADKSASLPAWQGQVAVLQKWRYDSGRVRALLARGMLALSQRGLLLAEQEMMGQVSATLKDAKLPVPPQFSSGQLTARIDELTKIARAAFEEADAITGFDKQQDNVFDSASADKYQKSEAHLIAQYGLARTEGNTPAARDALRRAQAQFKVMVSTGNNGLEMVLPQWPEDVQSVAVTTPAPPRNTPPAPSTAPGNTGPGTSGGGAGGE